MYFVPRGEHNLDVAFTLEVLLSVEQMAVGICFIPFGEFCCHRSSTNGGFDGREEFRKM